MFLIFAMSVSLPSFADAASLKKDLINAIRSTGEEETSQPGVKTILMTKKTASPGLAQLYQFQPVTHGNAIHFNERHLPPTR